MKNACILFFCVLGSFWVSCQDELETSLNGVSTRVIVDGSNVSVTNPQLLNDWENVQTIVLNVTPEKKLHPLGSMVQNLICLQIFVWI